MIFSLTMTFGTYPYDEEIRSMLNSMNEQRRELVISLFQGKGEGAFSYVDWLRNSQYSCDEISAHMDALCMDVVFRELVLRKHKAEYHNEVTWEFYITYSLTGYIEILPSGYQCRQCALLGLVYDWYSADCKQRFPAYYPNNPLETYYQSKGFDLNMSDNYGLVDTTDFEIKVSNCPKLYDKRLDTHILLKHVPESLLSYLIDERTKANFKLALRPNYDICGDDIKDFKYVFEAKICGDMQPLAIDCMPPLTWLCDDTTSMDSLIILHNKKTHEITFEEFLADPQIENDYIISQVVHLMYTKSKGNIYINHLDHEYVFYTADEHTEKMENLQLKGTARPRYKTFKIDDANIPYRAYCDQNILYRTLDAYFINKNMLKEYFEAMINNRVAGTMNIINRLGI